MLKLSRPEKMRKAILYTVFLTRPHFLANFTSEDLQFLETLHIAYQKHQSLTNNNTKTLDQIVVDFVYRSRGTFVHIFKYLIQVMCEFEKKVVCVHNDNDHNIHTDNMCLNRFVVDIFYNQKYFFHMGI